MRKIAVFLTKGGVGKTTTAVNIAAGLTRAGAKVLLIDTDTQGHVGTALGVQPPAGLAQVLANECTAVEAMVEARENDCGFLLVNCVGDQQVQESVRSGPLFISASASATVPAPVEAFRGTWLRIGARRHLPHLCEQLVMDFNSRYLEARRTARQSR